jgi:hypothetical protein
MSLTYVVTDADPVDLSPAQALPPSPTRETPATPTRPDSARPRLHADPTRGTAVELIGVIEAIAVSDGQFTPVLRSTKYPRSITLRFTEQMREQALDNLCLRVAVGGRLYPSEADGYRLEVHNLRSLRRDDDEGQR